MSKPSTLLERYRPALVWACRIAIGALFIFSGVSKGIDPWGSLYKIEQYLAVWGLSFPHAVVLTLGCALSLLEFLTGFLLLLGCYRRTVAWLVMMIMAVMLPLTLYIVVANPVSDCGCFGDALHVSNLATFIKNLVITVMGVYLIRNNYRIGGLFTIYTQWLVVLMAAVYLLAVEFIGYNVQPMIDFRPYPAGMSLIADSGDDDDDTDTPEYKFYYSRNGVTKAFTADNLPDSTWTFESREQIGGETDVDNEGLLIYNGEGDEVSAQVIADNGPQIMLLIPDIKNIDVSSTFVVNELDRYVGLRGGSMIGIIAGDDDSVERWRYMSMADYPIYTAEDTDIKALARGHVAVVYLKDGVIKWKRALSAIPSDMFDSDTTLPEDLLDAYGMDLVSVFWTLTIGFIALELLLMLLDRSGRAVGLRLRSRKKSKQS